MRLLHLTAIVLLASSVLAVPISPAALSRRERLNTTVPGITPISVDDVGTKAQSLPTVGTCKALYFDPKADVPCGVVARQFDIYLTFPEYDQASTETWCESFLHANGICRAASTNSPSAFPTSRASTLFVSTIVPTPASISPGSEQSGAASSVAGTDGTASTPVAAVVGLNGSMVGVAALTTDTAATMTRGPVVLASERAAEYSATLQRNSSASVASFEEPVPASATIDETVESAGVSSLNYTLQSANTTRMINLTVGSGNSTSLRTVLVTAAQVATGSQVTGTGVTDLSANADSSNSTYALRRLRLRRQAAFGAPSSTYQVVNAKQTAPTAIPSLVDLAHASGIVINSAMVEPMSTEAASPSPLPQLHNEIPTGLPTHATDATLGSPTGIQVSSDAGALFAPTPTPAGLMISNTTTTAAALAFPSTESARMEPTHAPMNGPEGWNKTITSGQSGTTPSLAKNTTNSCIPPPGPIPSGGATSCSQWYVVAEGDTCDSVAARFGSQADLQTLNPTLNSDCKSLLEGSAYCVAPCDASSDSDSTPALAPSPHTGTGHTSVHSYMPYHGNGSAQEGWPQMSEWLSWEELVDANKGRLAGACKYWEVPENSPAEIDTLLDLTPRISDEGGVDPRVVLAMMLQESHGCLRVPETQGSHRNAGVLQSHNGNGTCNTNMIEAGSPGSMKDPSLISTDCSSRQIEAMIRDGILGTNAGRGLMQLMDQEQGQGYLDAQMWYRVARAYNSGSVDESNDLEKGAATHGYCSDVANRLVGWRSGTSGFEKSSMGSV
ncbi:hypothetical protein CBER1_00698 [Cercospora berteroae]|uniref:LysM domain-containing protein n=1 Tax=Cercospora berteroae TaxID=357750 RepID=A0A2S6C9J3_9PEZI|nr:hypothetical protein CBER1_00698 [Cercospora berteroae]